jgi:hypothetical protein
MFQRALAKRPEDRWGTALELAAALRAASGIGTTYSDLPRLDRDVRDAWLAGSPQPLAESIAELGGAHNAYQARDIAKGLILTLMRYLRAIALAMNARHRASPPTPRCLRYCARCSACRVSTNASGCFACWCTGWPAPPAPTSCQSCSSW